MYTCCLTFFSSNQQINPAVQEAIKIIDLAGGPGSTLLIRVLQRELLYKGNDINVFDKHGMNALSEAIYTAFQEFNLKLIDIMLELGADPFLKNEAGQSALTIAVGETDYPGRGSKIIIRTLLHPKLSMGALEMGQKKSSSLNTSIQEVIRDLIALDDNEGLIGFLNFILDRGTDINNATDDYGNTALHCALHYAVERREFDSFRAIKILLEHGADPHAENIYGITPYTMAAEERTRDTHNELISLLSGEKIEKKTAIFN